MKRSLLLILFFILLSLVTLGGFVVYQSSLFTSRANLTATTFSADNSYVFATPLRAKANGLEKVRVTVFVLNAQGLGVLGRAVTLSNSENVFVDPLQPVTDNVGKAFFDLSTRTSGEYTIEVKVDNVLLPQKLQISFN